MRRAPLLALARPDRTPRRAARLVVTSAAGLALALGLGAGTAGAATPTQSRPTGATTHTAVPAHKSAAEVAAERAAFGKSVLREAARHAGTPYVYGASGPGAFDCSGFTRYVFAKLGISLPHSSYGQWAEVEHIPTSQARPGDIVFLNGLGHVGIYAGHGMMWDAPSPGGHVSLRPIYSSVYKMGRIRL